MADKTIGTKSIKEDAQGNKIVVLPRNTAILAPQENRALNTKQINALHARTPNVYLKKRPAKGGGQWDYVTASYVKRQLNRIFGHENWDFEIKSNLAESFEIATRTQSCTVLGRLTVRVSENKTIVKEQFGRAEVKFKSGTTKPLDFGNDMKSAGSDALKKCASDLGIASDVYNKLEYIEIEIEDAEGEVTPKEVASATEKSKMTSKADSLLESLEDDNGKDTK
jgi:recombination DNA repair RAD52 pathway protein